jgi:hypothetical protein
VFRVVPSICASYGSVDQRGWAIWGMWVVWMVASAVART